MQIIYRQFFVKCRSARPVFFPRFFILRKICKFFQHRPRALDLRQIKSTLKSGEPATGTELERTFQYQGGGEYHVTAESGPVEVTVTDLDNSKQYVRFYVREGETGIIYLPAGRYSVSYNVGYIWFNDRIGFGDYCTNYTIDGELTYEVKSDNAWITNNVWESTL